MHHVSAREYPPLSFSVSQAACQEHPKLSLLPSIYEHSTGVSVNATTMVDAARATMNAMPSGNKHAALHTREEKQWNKAGNY